MSSSDAGRPETTSFHAPGPLRLGVLVSGNGSNLQSIIDHIEAGEVPAIVACVISNRKGAYALERAARHSIPAFVLDHREYADRESFDGEMVRILKEHGVGLVVLAGFNRILSMVMLDAFPLAIVNIHPALLPAFPGGHAQRMAADYGVKIAGCTVHFVDPGTDTGPIIAQAAVPVLDGDTDDTLAKRILREEHKIYPAAIRLFAQGRLRLEGRKVVIAAVTEAPERFLENPPL